ncbi:prolyl-tRNA synthetase [Candidatus Saccharibacteria bacterium]|nr:prolyl-tRNA synthetase [Candidatus Saccharibacteria bacterium]
MRMSKTFVKTLREAPKGEEARNAQLLIRAGYVHKEMAGVYDYLPLGLRVLEKIKQIIREELNRISAEEILMSTLQKPEPWKKSERWDDQEVDIWFKTELASGGELGLAPTHEEPVTELLKTYVASYKDLPRAVYQFQTKFRNELRAKSGILRGREFLMKDLYSFHQTEADLDEFYQKVEGAYAKIFERLGIGAETFETFASGGIFTKYSHEYQTLIPVGEDTIFYDKEKKVFLNKEVYNEEVLRDLGIPEGTEFLETAGAEVGNIFKLKFKYSEPLGLNFQTKEGERQTVYMGCYGIGVSRVFGVIVERFADEKGLVLPEAVAPYKYYLVANGEKGTAKATEIYEKYREKDEMILDDRDVRFGEKMKDAELMGIPVRVVISDRGLETGEVEVTERATGETRKMTLDKVFGAL